MKILVFAPFSCANGQHETDLEICCEYLSRGFDVHVIRCRGEFATCDPNPYHKHLTCLVCVTTGSQSFQRIGIKKTNYHWLDLKPPSSLVTIPHFRDISELKKFTWKQLPAGAATASLIIGALCRDTEPDLGKYRSVIERGILSWVSTYEAIERHLDEIGPDIFYLFGGRGGPLNAALTAAKHRVPRILVGERDKFNEYILTENATGLDVEYSKSQMTDLVSRFDEDPRSVATASEWFMNNRNGNRDSLCNYLGEQDKGKLPSPFDSTKRNIAVFLSSEDEIASYPGLENPLFQDQFEGLRYLLSQIQDPSFHFHIRMHPNLKGIDCAQNRKMFGLSAENMTLIPPESFVDSYALLEASEKVLTFGSTIGIEAVFWNKPTIVCGRTVYEHLDACYIPKSNQELVELIQAILIPKDKRWALLVGYWWKTRGTQLRHIVPTDPRTGKIGSYQGKPLQAPQWVRKLLSLYARWRQLIGFFSSVFRIVRQGIRLSPS